jgi:NDP-sugar pyrophosphorylase family protein
MLTYGDGVSDIDISELVKFHKSHGKAMTMTSAQPDGRFGALNIDENNQVHEFKEKPKRDFNSVPNNSNWWVGIWIKSNLMEEYVEDRGS